MSEAFVMDNSEMHSIYLNDRIPAEIAENLKEFFPEHGDLSFEEVLLQQESAYYYIQSNGKNKEKTSDSNQTSNRSPSPVQEGESSHNTSVESQLALDEALARSLQELGEDFEDLYVSEHSGHVTESRESTPRQTTPARVTSDNIRQDDVDLDNMTYEVKFSDVSFLLVKQKGYNPFISLLVLGIVFSDLAVIFGSLFL